MAQLHVSWLVSAPGSSFWGVSDASPTFGFLKLSSPFAGGGSFFAPSRGGLDYNAAMRQRFSDNSLGDGVYFAPHDYVGLGPRIPIFIIDSNVLVAVICFVTFAWLTLIGGHPNELTMLLGFCIWLYVVPVKRSKTRTLGYWLLGCRLVTLQGNRPSLLKLTVRSMLWVFGPFNFLFDLIWCSIDEDRQSLRDRFTSMCLVKNHAQPIASGAIHLAYYNAASWNLIFPHVVHRKPATAA